MIQHCTNIIGTVLLKDASKNLLLTLIIIDRPDIMCWTVFERVNVLFLKCNE